MEYADYINTAQELAEDIIRDACEEWKKPGSASLDDILDDFIHAQADNLCIWTKDNRDLVRMLEDWGTVDNFMEFVFGDQTREQENVAIAYDFWSTTIREKINEQF